MRGIVFAGQQKASAAKKIAKRKMFGEGDDGASVWAGKEDGARLRSALFHCCQTGERPLRRRLNMKVLPGS